MPNTLVVIAALLIAGVALRARITPLHRARIPASVVGGVLGLLLVNLLWLWPAARTPLSLTTGQMRGWGGTLIAIVFAGLLLVPTGADRVGRSADVWRQGIAAWVIILGQLALGLIATSLLIAPFYVVPAPFGQYIEVTMAGGFGSARAMGALLASPSYNFPQGTDLLTFGATVGLLWGVLSGLVLTRLGQRRGWTAGVGVMDEVEHQPGHATRSSSASDEAADVADRLADAVEPLAFQAALLALAFGVGLLGQFLVAAASRQLDGAFPTDGRFARHLGDLPLFFFTLLGGWLVRLGMSALGIGAYIDGRTIHRLVGVAMDVLIVASLASVQFAAVRAYLGPALLLLAIGWAWSVWCLLWLSPRLLPRRYWFELGLINYGFSTAATAQGMMFLRMVDRELRTGAAQTYALAAPLTSPFIGGGLITFAVLPPLISTVGPLPVAALAAVTTLLLIVLGMRMSRRAEASPPG